MSRILYVEVHRSLTAGRMPLGPLSPMIPSWTRLVLRISTGSSLKWTILGQSGRSLVKLDDIWSNWTISGLSGRSWVKLDDLESKWTILDQSGRSWIKVDGLEGFNWTAKSNKTRSSTFTLWFHLIVQFKSNDRLLWPMTFQFASKCRLLWPGTVRFEESLGFERPFTSKRTVHFRPNPSDSILRTLGCHLFFKMTFGVYLCMLYNISCLRHFKSIFTSVLSQILTFRRFRVIIEKRVKSEK